MSICSRAAWRHASSRVLTDVSGVGSVLEVALATQRMDQSERGRRYIPIRGQEAEQGVQRPVGPPQSGVHGPNWTDFWRISSSCVKSAVRPELMVPRAHWPVLPPASVGGSRWALVAPRDTIRTGGRTGLLRVNTLRVSVVDRGGTWTVANWFRLGPRRRGRGSGSELPSLISWWDAAAEDEPQNQPGPGARLPAQVPAGGRQRRREGRDSGEPAGRSIRVPVRIQHRWVSELEPGRGSVIGQRRTCQVILEVDFLFLRAADSWEHQWMKPSQRSEPLSEGAPVLLLHYIHLTGPGPPLVLFPHRFCSSTGSVLPLEHRSVRYVTRTSLKKTLDADHRSVNQNSDGSSEPPGDPVDGRRLMSRVRGSYWHFVIINKSFRSYQLFSLTSLTSRTFCNSKMIRWSTENNQLIDDDDDR